MLLQPAVASCYLLVVCFLLYSKSNCAACAGEVDKQPSRKVAKQQKAAALLKAVPFYTGRTSSPPTGVSKKAAHNYREGVKGILYSNEVGIAAHMLGHPPSLHMCSVSASPVFTRPLYHCTLHCTLHWNFELGIPHSGHTPSSVC
jgi:hypothetical protein